MAIQAGLQGDGGPNGFGGDLLFQVKTDNGAMHNALYIDNNGNIGLGTSRPQATLDVNGTAHLQQFSSRPFNCSVSSDGVLAMTTRYTMCVCKGSAGTWVSVNDGSTACVWS